MAMNMPRYLAPRYCIKLAPMRGETILVIPSIELNTPSVPPTFSLLTDFVMSDVMEMPRSAEKIESGVKNRMRVPTLLENEYSASNKAVKGVRYFTRTCSANFFVNLPTRKPWVNTITIPMYVRTKLVCDSERFNLLIAKSAKEDSKVVNPNE